MVRGVGLEVWTGGSAGNGGGGWGCSAVRALRSLFRFGVASAFIRRLPMI
jgi:hypothetical protein